MQQHIKDLTKSLALIGDAISEEDRVVHLLASLPNFEVSSNKESSMEFVTELLRAKAQRKEYWRSWKRSVCCQG